MVEIKKLKLWQISEPTIKFQIQKVSILIIGLEVFAM